MEITDLQELPELEPLKLELPGLAPCTLTCSSSCTATCGPASCGWTTSLD